MTRLDFATLDQFEGALSRGGYTVEFTELAGERVLVGETAYALVACIQVDDCVGLAERVADVQASLTKFAASAPSPRKWDLYLVVHVLTAPTDAAGEAELEEIASDTRYARKFIRVHIADSEEAIDKALRPLLPLRLAASFDLADTLDVLREELRTFDLSEQLVSSALDSFKEGKEVSVP